MADETQLPSSEDQSDEVLDSQEQPQYFEPNFDPSSLDDSLQPAYKQLQGAWTRKTQELAEERKEAQQAIEFVTAVQQREPWALEQLGFDTDDNEYGEELAEPDELEDDDNAFYDPRVDELIEYLEDQESSVEEEHEAQEHLSHVTDAVDQWFSEAEAHTGHSFSSTEKDWLVSRGVAIGDDENDIPDMNAAFAEYGDLWKSRRKELVNGKSAPFFSSSTSQAFEKQDTSTKQGRLAALERAVLDHSD